METLFTVVIILLLSIAVEKYSIVMMMWLQNAIPLIHIIHQLYIYIYILMCKLIVECPWPDRGGWESYNSHGAGTFVYPFNYRSRNRHRNLWDGQCVSSWWPPDWFGYLHGVKIDIWFTYKSLVDGVCHLFYLYWLMGKGMAYGGLPFLGTGCPVPDVANIYLIWNV